MKAEHPGDAVIDGNERADDAERRVGHVDLGEVVVERRALERVIRHQLRSEQRLAPRVTERAADPGVVRGEMRDIGFPSLVWNAGIRQQVESARTAVADRDMVGRGIEALHELGAHEVPQAGIERRVINQSDKIAAPRH